MAATAKTIVATGCTSGLGFELVKQLLAETQPYKFILGARDIKTTQAAYDKLQYDSRHSLTILPVELSNMQTVKSFAQQTLEKLGQDPVDYLLLNAAIARNADDRPGPNGSQWCDSYVINHLSQHYLVHLLRSKLEASHSRIVVVSSGAIRMIKDTTVLEDDVKAGAKTERMLYPTTKFIQLLGAHWWRRELQGTCKVVVVSPGLIPGTGLGRFAKPGDPLPSPSHPDAKGIPDGAQSILAALMRNDLPEDPEQIFLTSWGEWWPKNQYGLSLDKTLQDKWCPGKEDIEKAEGVMA
ncbi:hypothetical protein VSDG_07627 [Cytospora chrysosperma]|uniref:Ketoreductase (KR) domain-containing protein n=1 Tax=Cytospora chrysosperma TaxID=252740 RepID=A0A423VLY4_CYTCH|nr:hypothetical protein VSDG_07627 [Valsa sordida]